MSNLNRSLAQDVPASRLRTHRKKQMLFPAICCYDQGKSRLDCIIRNLSKTDMRISFARASQLAQSVQTINVRDMLVYDATVTWKSESEAVLAITRTRALSDVTGLENAYLRRYWFERAMR